jgi:hypothetical protein
MYLTNFLISVAKSVCERRELQIHALDIFETCAVIVIANATRRDTDLLCNQLVSLNYIFN